MSLVVQYTPRKIGASTDSAAIAAAVWDEPTASHTTAGSFGVRVKKLLTFAKFLGLK